VLLGILDVSSGIVEKGCFCRVVSKFRFERKTGFESFRCSHRFPLVPG
jgi:hypothetical protein